MSRAYGMGLLVLFIFGAFTGCGDEANNGKGDDSATDDASVSTETGMGTDSVTEGATDTNGTADSAVPASTDSATHADIATDDQPPALPVRCSAHTTARKLSGAGSGTLPSLSGDNGSMMAAFTYDTKESGASPQMQLGYFDAENSSWLTVFPFDDSVTSSSATLASYDGARALVWVDARTEWDADCTPDRPSACSGDVAFVTVTDGQIDQPMPVRTSLGGGIVGTPAVVATATGWVVTWVNNDNGNTTVWSAMVASDGSVSAPVNISGEYRATQNPALTMATLNDTVLVMWGAYHQQAIFYAMLDSHGLPLGSVLTLAEGTTVFAPRVTAGHTSFLVSYGARRSRDIAESATIFTRMIDATGQPLTAPTRITWTDTAVTESFPAYRSDMGNAIVWLSAKANGSLKCVDSVCMTKVFASILDDTGALASEPVLLSEGATDLNPCAAVTLNATSDTWFVAYEIRRNLRQQILYSTFTCE
ncbi:MAG: hypothetical protein JXX14_15070 [Deltaproteobacteria bacterium]|nr:hypothetical protein [Deltaproteobacteria bacterium]